MDSDTLGRALLPLRAFLGFTFCFAGLQKLANPGFFSAGNPGSIQSQLAGSARSSPVGALISPLVHVAVPLGLLIAFAELAIGMGTLLGLWQRLAAAGGVALSFLLFLTVSFHAAPYYTGADIVFAFAWTPLLLAGAGPVLSADAALAARARRESPKKASQEEISRREMVLKGSMTTMMAVGGLLVGGMAAGLGRAVGGLRGSSGSSKAAAPSLRTASPTSPGNSTHAASGGSGASGGHSGTVIGPAKDVPVGGAASFNAPGTGDPAIVLQPRAGKFLAFDAVCPHAGCPVEYDTSADLLVCPCHGSQFSASTGAVESGPAAKGLTPISVSEGGNGDLYAT